MDINVVVIFFVAFLFGLFWMGYLISRFPDKRSSSEADIIYQKVFDDYEMDVTEHAVDNKLKRDSYEYIEYQRNLYFEALLLLHDMDYINEARDYLNSAEGEDMYPHYPELYAQLTIILDIMQEYHANS